ncbi:hypothetical protein J4461_02835 [Candidatus Pacearchaeota archaeon]|nr:hypothetical protein [Candidatus Pacearchaeota archaeon]
MKNLAIAFLITLIMVQSALALVITDVDAPELMPGEEGILKIFVENTLNKDIEDVSLSLHLQELPFAIVGSSESSIDEIEEDDTEDFSFLIRAAPTATPGDYQIPYTLSYENISRAKTGVIGVRIEGSVELASVVIAEKPVIKEKDTLIIRIINNGFADARYVNVRLVPNGFTALSDTTLYIGDIDANDFESASFEVIYTSENPIVEATIEYRDFNNQQRISVVQESLTIYTREEAIERGIIERTNTLLYISIISILIIIFIVVRIVRRRIRRKKSLAAAQKRQ